MQFSYKGVTLNFEFSELKISTLFNAASSTGVQVTQLVSGDTSMSISLKTLEIIQRLLILNSMC